MQSSPARLHNLDYLRGLSAFAIMIYHYSNWSFGNHDGGTFIGRLGIYGVAIFYVLSGLTLYHVYHTNFRLVPYIKKRVLRIYPLLWLATIATFLVHRIVPDVYRLALNFTGLFGFLKFDAYYAEGAWSIGNELVFYVFFPLFLWMSTRLKYLLIFTALLAGGVHMYFAFYLLNPANTLIAQWTTYINPLNQIFLFFAGFLIGYILKTRTISHWLSLFMIVAGTAGLIFYPIEGDQIRLVTGIHRLSFTLLCICICIGFYKLRLVMPNIVDKPLAMLGEASYSVYLLHPLVWWTMYMIVSATAKYIGFEVTNLLIMSVSIPVAIAVSYFVYAKFEKYFMKLGKSKEGVLYDKGRHSPIQTSRVNK